MNLCNLWMAFFCGARLLKVARSFTAMKTIILSISVFTFLLFNSVAQQTDYSQLRNDAEAEYAQGSYSRANELYSKVDKSKLNRAEQRWVEFRLADTTWRSQAATQTPDTTRFEQAQKQ